MSYIGARGKSRFTVVRMENSTMINNTRIISVFHALTTGNLLLLHPDSSPLVTAQDGTTEADGGKVSGFGNSRSQLSFLLRYLVVC